MCIRDRLSTLTRINISSIRSTPSLRRRATTSSRSTLSLVCHVCLPLFNCLLNHWLNSPHCSWIPEELSPDITRLPVSTRSQSLLWKFIIKKLINARLSYSHLKIENLGSVRHLGFQGRWISADQCNCYSVYSVSCVAGYSVFCRWHWQYHR